ncbi:MAG: DNA primase, partial [Clostridiales bacterium]|nr:DNA primase [Clostridiales bacterium]
MIYSDEIIERVRESADIVDIVSKTVHLEKKGRNFFGLCPFHAEKTPSFSVNPEKRIFYCFSCNRGGDAFRFVMDTENLDFPSAVRKLADMAHIALPADSAEGRKSAAEAAREKERRNRLYAMNEDAAELFRASLANRSGARAREYLRAREVSPGAAAKFGLGYAPGEWGGMRRFLLSKGYTDDEQLAGGLVVRGSNGECYDRFRNRLMFPIMDVAGRTAAFGGRVLDDSVPKYMNSPETPIYSKGQMLFGLNFAKETKESLFLLVEGYMDLITLSACGVDNAIAPLGTALTPAQGKLLKRYRSDVVIAFDSDAAGKKAALRGLDILDSLDIGVKVLSLPSGKDPDEYVRNNGPAAFRKLIADAATLVDYKLGLLEAQFPPDSTEGRIKFMSGAVDVLRGVRGSIKREIYVKKIAARHGISEKAIMEEIAAGESAQAARGARGGTAAGLGGGNEAHWQRGARPQGNWRGGADGT